MNSKSLGAKSAAYDEFTDADLGRIADMRCRTYGAHHFLCYLAQP